MPANTSPIYTLTPKVTGLLLTGSIANAKSNGVGTIGTDIFKAFTAGASGSLVSRIRFVPNASVASTATTATVIRVWVSSVTSGATTGSDTFLIGEISAPAQTSAVPTTAVYPLELSLNFPLQTGWFIHVSIHHALAANTTWQAVTFGGDY